MVRAIDIVRNDRHADRATDRSGGALGLGSRLGGPVEGVATASGHGAARLRSENIRESRLERDMLARVSYGDTSTMADSRRRVHNTSTSQQGLALSQRPDDRASGMLLQAFFWYYPQRLNRTLTFQLRKSK